MSLSKSICWYSNNCLRFFKCAVPLKFPRSFLVGTVVQNSTQIPKFKASTPCHEPWREKNMVKKFKKPTVFLFLSISFFLNWFNLTSGLIALDFFFFVLICWSTSNCWTPVLTFLSK
jgi:hypothetical protein